MEKLKLLIIRVCFKVIDRLMDESQIVEPDTKLEKQIEELVEGVDVEPLNKEVRHEQAKECTCGPNNPHHKCPIHGFVGGLRPPAS